MRVVRYEELKNKSAITEDDGVEMIDVAAKINKDGSITLEPIEKSEEVK